MWTKQQQMAINKKNSNILVSASAGSGKTAVLVERVISTCINEKVDIDKLLVVTFTNAAAAELKERLINVIYTQLKLNPKDRFLKRQLKLMSRANITTMHAFCLNLIKSNFYNLDIDPSFKICEETEANLLKNRAIANVIEKEYIKYNQNFEKKGEDKEISLSDLLELFMQNENTMMEEILKLYNYSLSFPYPLEYIKNSIEIYNVYDKKEDLSKLEFGKDIINDVQGNIRILKKRCENLIEEIIDHEGFEKYLDVLQDDIFWLEKIINTITWDELYLSLSKVNLSNNPRYTGDNEELKDKLMYFRNNVLKKNISKYQQAVYAPSEDICKQNEIAYEYLKFIYDIIEKIDAEYVELKKRKNLIDFSDIEHLALKLLTSKEGEKRVLSQVALELKDSFYEVYTDEYQDTSYVQEEILNSISKENNRFMVGDIKQSIYKFRQAMPDIFNEKYLKFETLENETQKIDNCKILLDNNFRSKKIVLDSINFIFEKIMSMKIGDSNYTKEETLKAGNKEFKDFENQDYSTQINILDLKRKAKNSSSDENSIIDDFLEDKKSFEVEAMFIAKKIKELVLNFKIYDLKKKEFRNARYKDIAILLRSTKGKAEILEKVLKEEKIPAFSDSSSSLLESEEVKLVICFLKILDNPLQDIYLASIMYSIVGKFTLDELVSIREINKKENLYFNILHTKENLEKKENITEKDKLLLSKINRFLNLIYKFNEYKYVFNISQLLTRIYRETNLYYEFAYEQNAKLRAANLDMLIDIARSFEKNENQTLSSYIEYIDNMREKKGTINAAKVIGENEDVVRIMTIHKSKGLEFGIVILADTNKKYNFRDKSTPIIMHHKLGIGINIIESEKRIAYPSVIKKAVENAIDNETRSEELRMLYVALTRAKEKLIIFSTINDYETYKESELLLYENGKIDPSLISKNNSYFQNIHMALKDCDNKLFDVKVISAEQLAEDDDKEKRNIGNLAKIKQLVESENIDNKEIQEKLNYEYKYNDYVKVPKRVSVTSLKEEKNSLENIIIDDEYINTKYSIAKVVNSDEMTSMQRGSFIHLIMEHLDFSIKDKTQLEKYLDKLVKDKVITHDQLKFVNKISIMKFLKSDLAKKINASSYVRREEEFVINDEILSLSQIQGIIDLYFLNQNGNFEIVDFKTDRLDLSEEFTQRYKVQLDTYARAVEKITGKKVDRKIIYSLHLNREIEV